MANNPMGKQRLGAGRLRAGEPTTWGWVKPAPLRGVTGHRRFTRAGPSTHGRSVVQRTSVENGLAAVSQLFRGWFLGLVY